MAAVVTVLVPAGASAGSMLLVVPARVVCTSACWWLMAVMVVMVAHWAEGTGAIAWNTTQIYTRTTVRNIRTW